MGQPSRPQFLEQKTTGTAKKTTRTQEHPPCRSVNKVASVQISSRLPEPDVAKARELTTRKGIGYQTLPKMLVHEGLRREARRA